MLAEPELRQPLTIESRDLQRRRLNFYSIAGQFELWMSVSITFGFVVQFVGIPIVLGFQGSNQLYNKLNIFVFVTSCLFVILQFRTLLYSLNLSWVSGTDHSVSSSGTSLRSNDESESKSDESPQINPHGLFDSKNFKHIANCVFVVSALICFPYSQFIASTVIVKCKLWQIVLSTFGTAGLSGITMLVICNMRMVHFLSFFTLRNRCLDEFDYDTGVLNDKNHENLDTVREHLKDQYKYLKELKINSEWSLLFGAIEFLISTTIIAILLLRRDHYNLVTINLTTVSCVPFLVNLITCYLVNREIEKVESELTLRTHLEIKIFGLYKVDYFVSIGIFISLGSYILKNLV